MDMARRLLAVVHRGCMQKLEDSWRRVELALGRQDDVVRLGVDLAGHMPLDATQATQISLGAGYAGVKRSYIRCDDDRTIPPEYQRTMTEGWAQADVYAMPTGHSPFFADPEGLADLLTQIAKG